MNASLLALVVALSVAMGAASGEPLTLKGIPGQLRWRNSPISSEIQKGEILSIIAGKTTDWFIDPFDGRTVSNSPVLLFAPGKDFVFSAKVTVDFRSKWDAGALVMQANDTTWAKLSLELSPEGKPTLVTVVTRGVSDDCNSFSISRNSVYLQMARSGPATVFYASTDGRGWQVLRTFRLGEAAELRAGFSAQSPTGESCKAVFSDIKYSPKRIANIYTGK